jgi:hypothetical protein
LCFSSYCSQFVECARPSVGQVIRMLESEINRMPPINMGMPSDMDLRIFRGRESGGKI